MRDSAGAAVTAELTDAEALRLLLAGSAAMTSAERNIPHARKLAGLAAAQRENADELLAAVREANDSGMSWQQIGAVLGVKRETVFRQAQAGSPIVVVRPRQRPPQQ